MNKRFILAVGIWLAMAFIFSCSSPNSENENSNEQNIIQSSSDISQPSSSSIIVLASSSSTYIPPIQLLYVADIGMVCVGYANYISNINNGKALDNQYFTNNNAHQNFIDMYNYCGNRSGAVQTGNSAAITNFLRAKNLTDKIEVINQKLFIENGAAYLGFYPAVDGYLRYLYIEIFDDGKGLAKTLTNEDK